MYIHLRNIDMKWKPYNESFDKPSKFERNQIVLWNGKKCQVVGVFGHDEISRDGYEYDLYVASNDEVFDDVPEDEIQPLKEVFSVVDNTQDIINHCEELCHALVENRLFVNDKKLLERNRELVKQIGKMVSEYNVAATESK
jgi:hypothetical protein